MDGWDAFDLAMYRALLDLGDDIHKLPSLYENWREGHRDIESARD